LVTGRIRGESSCVESACDRLYIADDPIQTRSAHQFFPQQDDIRDQRDSCSVHEVTTRHFIIATAGMLIMAKARWSKPLTGTDPDRLPEEKRKGGSQSILVSPIDVTAPNGDKIHAGSLTSPAMKISCAN